VHRGVALRNPRCKPFWLRAEGDEWQGLWEKGVFKKWNRSDLLPNDRVFTSRYVYKIKRSAKTGEAYKFKARMIVRGLEMENAFPQKPDSGDIDHVCVIQPCMRVDVLKMAGRKEMF
jgi:hypothetical protein